MPVSRRSVSLRSASRGAGLTLIQFMVVLLVLGLVAAAVVRFLLDRIA